MTEFAAFIAANGDDSYLSAVTCMPPELIDRAPVGGVGSRVDLERRLQYELSRGGRTHRWLHQYLMIVKKAANAAEDLVW